MITPFLRMLPNGLTTLELSLIYLTPILGIQTYILNGNESLTSLPDVSLRTSDSSLTIDITTFIIF